MAKNPLIRSYPKRVNKPLPNKSAGLLEDYAEHKVISTKEGSITKTPINDIDIVNKKYVDDSLLLIPHASTTGQTTDDHHAEAHTLASHSSKDHSELTSVTSDQHHAQSHTVASHSDTTATGTELNTLTDNSIANTLHRHSELVASDGSPDPAVSVDASGNVGIGTASIPVATQLKVLGTGNNAMVIDSTTGNSAVQIRGSNHGRFEVIDTGAISGFQVYQLISDGGAFEFRRTNDAVTAVLATPFTIKNDNIGINTTNPATSAKLEISSTTGALLLPRMTTTQRDALTAVNGMLIYNSTLNKFQGYENGAWTSLI